jgi:LuxR family maltose regulon positive regulatory protein
MPVRESIRATRPAGRLTRAPRPALDVIQAKIRPPTLRPGTVPRETLVNALCRDSGSVVTTVAPAGYGKTTLLAQWAKAESRPVAWISLDARDDDPFVLLRHVVAALDEIGQLDPRALASLAAVRPPAWPPTLDRAARAIAMLREPLAVVVDDADVLHSREARMVLAILAARAPTGSTVAFAGRARPKLTPAALRSRGDTRAIGVPELSLSKREAQLLLHAANLDLPAELITDLIERCEGWAAALYLASVSLAAGSPSRRSGVFAGSDRYLADYIRGECLSRLSAQDLRFLRRTSMLRELSPRLCDAVLQAGDSGRVLDRLARGGVLVVPVAGRRGWFRHHRLFRDVLLRDLVEEEPELIPALHRRAADWYEAAGDQQATLEHADAAGDLDRVAAIITAVALPGLRRGGVPELERWLARFAESRQLEGYPAVALHGSRIHAYGGRRAEAEQWLEAAERGTRRARRNAAALRPRLAVVRASLCRNGPRRMLADAGAALAGLDPGAQWYPVALHMRATAATLLGATAEAEELLSDARGTAEPLGLSATQMLATAQLSLLVRARGDRETADALATEARQTGIDAELERHPTFALALVVSAQAALPHGRWAEARDFLRAAEPLRALVNEALPWLAVLTRLELVGAYLTLRDNDAALTAMGEIEPILTLRPRLGTLAEQARELREELQALTAPPQPGPPGLTPAELRLLPLLATHLSFREIAEQLRVSRNTVKTQAISIYRKLGVSGRSEAIAAAGALPEGPA